MYFLRLTEGTGRLYVDPSRLTEPGNDTLWTLSPEKGPLGILKLSERERMYPELLLEEVEMLSLLGSGGTIRTSFSSELRLFL